MVAYIRGSGYNSEDIAKGTHKTDSHYKMVNTILEEDMVRAMSGDTPTSVKSPPVASKGTNEEEGC